MEAVGELSGVLLSRGRRCGFFTGKYLFCVKKYTFATDTKCCKSIRSAIHDVN